MKTKNFLSMAALALMGAMMTGCSSDDNFDNPQQPENKSKVVTLTTTVGLDGGATTRALSIEGNKGVKTFKAGETMAVIYNNGSSTVKAVSHALVVDDITNEGKTATFTFDLETPYKNQEVTYIYPAAMAGETGVDLTKLNTQEGTFDALQSKYDLCTKSGDWDGENLPSLTLENQLAILAITLKDNAATPSEITGDITDMTVSDGTNTYTVTRSAAEGPIYVAILPTSGATINVTATDGTNYYAKSLTNKTYEVSNGYNVSWRMTELPEGALPGQFTISDDNGEHTRLVYFSKGNLQATTTNKGTSWTWAFAANQWSYVGYAAPNGAIIGNKTVSENGTVDLFGWSTADAENYLGIHKSNDDFCYSGNFVDWGSHADVIEGIGSGWRTLTRAEWTYLFNIRSASTVGTTEDARYAKAKVNTVQGIILFPDTYTHPDGVTAPTGVNATDDTGWNGNNGNNYSSADWTKMEKNGAVFLPAAGYRDWEGVNYAGDDGYYWSSTADGNENAHYVYFSSSDLVVDEYTTSRYNGHSVRLVRPVQ